MSVRAATESLALRLSIPLIETAEMLACAPLLQRLPIVLAQRRCCALMTSPTDGQTTAVVHDPLDAELCQWLEAQAGGPVRYRLAAKADLQAYLARLEDSVKAVDSLTDTQNVEGQGNPAAEVLSLATAGGGASAAVRLVSSTLYDALKTGASDVHLECTSSGLAVKLRVDGVLHPALEVNGKDLAEQAISRLKVLAELDIAERRIPQDGSFRVRSGGRDIDLRVSVMPSIHGEDAVIRILDKQAMIEAHGALTLDALGFDAQSLTHLRRLTEQPYGMLLVTGPTGSGKTTTLYAAIAETHTGHDKIVTIEDPVEYQLSGVLQIPVNEKKGLTFAVGLRSILRHDPDKIMVGEIRDRETAEIAVQAALTGHLVLTTVHANSAFDVFGRFAYMGIDPYAFVSALAGIWAQRLVRVNCPRCSVPVSMDPAELDRAHLGAADVASYRFRRGRGCGDCRGTGYKGRRAVAEVLVLNDELRELIVDRRPMRMVREAAARHGMQRLRDAALALVAAGETTLEEVRRVAMES
jgi:general secretion pathway protein E